MLETFGMPSASDARYGAPPEASRSPLRFNSSVSVTCSIAGFSALLSSKIAPRTERSASRLFGKGFSSVVSAGMKGLLYIRLFFAFVPRSPLEGKRRNFHSRYGATLFKAMSHCAWKSCARQSESCASLRKSLDNFLTLTRVSDKHPAGGGN